MSDIIKSSDIIADMHTHTIFSKHAYSTIKENADIAAERGIEYLAVTDHYYGSDDYMERINELTRMAYIAKNVTHPWVHIISGAEFNLDHPIQSDVIPDKVCKNSPWRLVGFHSWFLNPSDLYIDEVPGYFGDAIRGRISMSDKDGELIEPTAFSHIERELYKCALTCGSVEQTLKDIVDLATHNNIVLEINETSILTNNASNHHVELMEYWISYALESNPSVMFSFGSDAHYCDMVGNFTNVIELANRMGIKPEQILNHRVNEEKLRKFLP